MANNRLILMRHAKSDWYSDASSDFARPLNERGRQDAPKMAAWLAQNGLVPQRAVCSTASRTRETLMLMCTHDDWQELEVEFENNLYMASLHNIQEVVDEHLLDAEGQTLMIVAHNPGLELALLDYCDHSAWAEEQKIMPTACAAVIDLHANGRSGDLVYLQRPKEL